MNSILITKLPLAITIAYFFRFINYNYNNNSMSFPVVADSVSQEGEKKSGLVNYEVEPGFSTRMRQNFYPTMNPKKLKRLHNFQFLSYDQYIYINQTLIEFILYM